MRIFIQNICIATPLVNPFTKYGLQVRRHIQGHSTLTYTIFLPLSKHQIQIRAGIGDRARGINITAKTIITKAAVARSLDTTIIPNIIASRTGIHTMRYLQCRKLLVDRCYGRCFGCHGGRISIDARARSVVEERSRVRSVSTPKSGLEKEKTPSVHSPSSTPSTSPFARAPSTCPAAPGSAPVACSTTRLIRGGMFLLAFATTCVSD